MLEELGPVLESFNHSLCDLCLLCSGFRSSGDRAHVSHAGTGVQIGFIECGAVYRRYDSRLGFQ